MFMRIASLFALTVLVLPVTADDKEDLHPIAAQVKGKLKDANKPFTMAVLLTVKEGAGAKLEAAFAKAIPPTRKEKGCIAYDLNHDTEKETRYVVYERWKSIADLQAHLKSAHITALLDEIKDVIDGSPEVRVLIPAAE
jgi:quinol monooxygenase YgiN